MQFPRAQLADALLSALGEPAAPALQYGWPEGAETLRRWIAERLAARGAKVDAGDVIVTSGAQEAIAIAAQLALAPGDRVRVDSASYPAALDLFRGRGAHPAAGGGSHRACYLMPQIANPRGVGMTEEQRRAVLDERIAILEDDAYAELRFDGRPGRPLLADARNRVWHIGTFSKVLCPGLRVGWLVPPPRFKQRALRLKHDRDLQASSLGQEVLVRYLQRCDFDERLVKLRHFYRVRAHRLAQAVARHLPAWRFRYPEGGFSLWVETGEDLDDAHFLQHAIDLGVSFDPGRLFRPGGASRPLALRLCFSLEPAIRLEEGVRRLARAWHTVSTGKKKDLHSPTFGC